MIKDKKELSKLWEKNAGIVADEAKKGIVSFAVLGDPNVFSTFSHLKRTIEKKYPGGRNYHNSRCELNNSPRCPHKYQYRQLVHGK